MLEYLLFWRCIPFYSLRFNTNICTFYWIHFPNRAVSLIWMHFWEELSVIFNFVLLHTAHRSKSLRRKRRSKTDTDREGDYAGRHPAAPCLDFLVFSFFFFCCTLYQRPMLVWSATGMSPSARNVGNFELLVASWWSQCFFFFFLNGCFGWMPEIRSVVSTSLGDYHVVWYKTQK